MQPSKQINHPLFYIETLTPADYFPNEDEFYRQNNGTWPWEAGERVVHELIDEWIPCKNKLEKLYAERDTNAALPLMVKGISLYLRLLFWTNSQPVVLQSLNEQVDKLEVKPANLQDRLLFLINRPSLYQSFVQLCELFTEQQKTYAKHLVMKKRVNR